MSAELDPKLVRIQPGSGWQRLPTIALVVAAIGLIGMAVTMDSHTMAGLRKFWSSYLHAFMFTMALGFGGLFFVVVQFVVRALYQRGCSASALISLM